MDESLFNRANVKLEYTHYTPSPCRQRFGDTFVPNLSIVDMLFNAGPGGRSLVTNAEQVGPRTPL